MCAVGVCRYQRWSVRKEECREDTLNTHQVQPGCMHCPDQRRPPRRTITRALTLVDRSGAQTRRPSLRSAAEDAGTTARKCRCIVVSLRALAYRRANGIGIFNSSELGGFSLAAALLELTYEMYGKLNSLPTNIEDGGRLPETTLARGTNGVQHLRSLSIVVEEPPVLIDIESEEECIRACETLGEETDYERIVNATAVTLRSHTVDDPRRTNFLLAPRDTIPISDLRTGSPSVDG